MRMSGWSADVCSSDLVIEHLLAEARTDPAVDPAGRGEFDHVGAAPDLEPHRAAAVVGAVAGVARARAEGAEFVAITERAVHLPRAARNAGPGIDDTRPLHLARDARVPERQRAPLPVPEIPHGDET